ncbi:MAG: hypothetical protein LBH98_05605 [Chitinispirillales bacterium]|jgi:hypothetical protein|nr:hypothetical protein [Chitinispirillales bacterium]
MSISKKLLSFAAFAALSLAVVGCGEKKVKDYGKMNEAVSVYPKEIQKLLDKEYKESISAVGQATHADQITALKKARFDATQQIAAQFQQEVASLQKHFLEAVNDSQTEDFRQTEEIFVLTTLHGDKVIKEMTTQGKDGYKAYVLRALDVAALKNMLDEQKNAQTLIKANSAYKELEARVEREKMSRTLTNE